MKAGAIGSNEVEVLRRRIESKKRGAAPDESNEIAVVIKEAGVAATESAVGWEMKTRMEGSRNQTQGSSPKLLRLARHPYFPAGSATLSRQRIFVRPTFLHDLHTCRKGHGSEAQGFVSFHLSHGYPRAPVPIEEIDHGRPAAAAGADEEVAACRGAAEAAAEGGARNCDMTTVISGRFHSAGSRLEPMLRRRAVTIQK